MINLDTLPVLPSPHQKVLCKHCNKPFTIYYEGKFWCQDCGEHAQLIKLIKRMYDLIQGLTILSSPSNPKTTALLTKFAKRNENQQQKFDFFLHSIKRLDALEKKVEIIYNHLKPEKRQ